LQKPNAQKYKDDFDKTSAPKSFAIGNLVWYQDFLTICKYSKLALKKDWTFPSFFFIYFSSIFEHNSILSCNRLSSCHAISTVDDSLIYGTLLSLELLEQLTLPESTEGLSPLSVCTSALGF
jgi:hypothetical protein